MSQHTEHSSYRERLIEHLFVAELLKLSWLNHNCSLEVAKPEVDNSGYDLIVEAGGTIRHVQLKTSRKGGKTASQKVHTRLATKQDGCVVWIYFDEATMELGPFYFLGGKPRQGMPSLDGFKVAKHSKGNKDGFKAVRQNIRVVARARFTKLGSMGQVYDQLFGPNNRLHCRRPR